MNSSTKNNNSKSKVPKQSRRNSRKTAPRLAKLTPPKVSGAIPRERLFKQLDRARNNPVVWVSALGGAGKTTLLSSYLDVRKIQTLWYQLDEADGDAAAFFYYLGQALKSLAPRRKALPLFTPEYSQGVSTFTRFFFRQLFDAMPPPGLIVLDNYQTVPENSLFHAVISVALEEIPSGGNVIVLSRHQPPAELSRLQANGQVAVIDEHALCLDENETEVMVQRWNKSPVPEAVKHQWQVHSEGWVAGFILLMERYQYGAETVGWEDNNAPENLFDYFASEIFSHTEERVQDFLLKSALLPTMDIANTTTLTQQRQAGKLLAEFVRKHYFTTRHAGRKAVYQYHPLFRAFLLARGREQLNAQLQHQLKQQAARILVEDNPEQSIAYWLELKDWGALTQTVEHCAPILLQQGRNQTVLDWLSKIPDKVLEQFPGLRYWQGASLQMIDAGVARETLTQAYKAFKTMGDAIGMYRAWSEISLGIWYERGDLNLLDPWLEELRYLRKYFSRIDSPILDAQFTSAAHLAVGLRGKDYSGMLSLEQKMIALVQSDLPLAQRLIIAIVLSIRNISGGGGDFSKVALCLKVLTPQIAQSELPPALGCQWFFVQALYGYWRSGNELSNLVRIHKALALAEESGMHRMDFILSYLFLHFHLTSGRQVEARESLHQLSKALNPNSRYEKTMHHCFFAWDAWLSGRLDEALEHAQTAERYIYECDHWHDFWEPQLILAQIHASRSNYRQAFYFTAKMRRAPLPIPSDKTLFLSYLADAQFALERNQPNRCHGFLRRALALARQQHCIRFPFFKPESVARLYAEALQENIEVDYVQEVIRQRHLAPPDDALNLDRWPWPLKIYGFGAIELVKDDVPIRFTRKAPKKPLQLLKALVALGGSQVTEQHLIDALWPDDEGDKAHTAFSTTLNRLRKLIGTETIIL